MINAQAVRDFYTTAQAAALIIGMSKFTVREHCRHRPHPCEEAEERSRCPSSVGDQPRRELPTLTKGRGFCPSPTTNGRTIPQ